jgi:hypothetical protein
MRERSGSSLNKAKLTTFRMDFKLESGLVRRIPSILTATHVVPCFKNRKETHCGPLACGAITASSAQASGINSRPRQL